MHTKCHTKLRVPWHSNSRMQTVWWWIEMSGGNNRGRIFNWLTDLLFWIEWVAKPLRMAINLKHNDDLLYSDQWVSEDWWNKKQCACYSQETTCVCLSPQLCLHVFMWYTAPPCTSVSCLCNRVYSFCLTPASVFNCSAEIWLWYIDLLYHTGYPTNNLTF